MNLRGIVLMLLLLLHPCCWCETTYLDCYNTRVEVLLSNTTYVLEYCSNVSFPPLFMECDEHNVANTTITIAHSVRPVSIQLKCPSVTNVSVVMVNCTFSQVTLPAILRVDHSAANLQLILRNVTMLNCVSTLLYLTMVFVHNVTVAIEDGSNVSLRGTTAVQSVLGQDVGVLEGIELRVIDSIMTVVHDARMNNKGSLFSIGSVGFDIFGISFVFVNATVTCAQQNMPDDPDPKNFACITLEVRHPRSVFSLSVVIRNTVMHVHGMPPSTGAGYSDAHVFILTGTSASISAIGEFPEGYSRFHEVRFIMSDVVCTMSAGSQVSVLYIDTGVVNGGHVLFENVSLTQRAMDNAPPLQVMRILTLVIVAAKTGFENAQIQLVNCNASHDILSGSVWANDTAALLDKRSLSNVRSTLLYIFYLENVVVLVSHSHIDCRMLGGAFTQRGVRRPADSPDLKVEIPLGVLTAFLVHLQSESNIYCRNSSVDVFASSLNISLDFTVSNSVLGSASMQQFFALNVSVYGYAVGLLSTTLYATHSSFTLRQCALSQYKASKGSEPWWSNMRVALQRSSLVNMSGLVVCQSVESALFSVAEVVSQNPFFQEFTVFIEGSLGVVVATSFTILSSSVYVESIGPCCTSNSALSYAIAAALILPNYVYQQSMFTVSGFVSKQSPQPSSAPFVSFIGVLSTVNVSMGSTVTVTDSVTPNGGIVWSLMSLHLTQASTMVFSHNYAAASLSSFHGAVPRRSPISTYVRFYGSGAGKSSQLVLSQNEFTGFQFLVPKDSLSLTTIRNGNHLPVVNISGCNSWNRQALTVGHVGLPRSAIMYADRSVAFQPVDGSTVYCVMSFTDEPSSSRTLAPPVETKVSSVQSAALSALASSSGSVLAVAASHMQSSHPVFLQVAFLAMRLVGSSGSCAYDVGIVESPTGLVIGPSNDNEDDEPSARLNGAIVGNTALLLCAAAAVAGCGCAVVYVERRQQSLVGLSVDASETRWWQRVAVRASLPGVLAVPLSLVLEPTVSSAVANLGSSTSADGPLARGIGVAGLSICVGITAWFVYNTMNLKGCHTVPRQKALVYLAASRDDTIVQRLRAWLHSITVMQFEWTSRKVNHRSSSSSSRRNKNRCVNPRDSKRHLSMYGALFDCYRGEHRSWFIGVELGIAIVCGIIGGLADTMGCLVSLGLLLAVAVVVLILGVVFAPYASTLLHVTFLFNAATTVLVCVIGVITYSSSEEDDSEGVTAATAIIYIQLLVNAVQIVLDCAGGLIHGNSRLARLWELVRSWKNAHAFKLFDGIAVPTVQQRRRNIRTNTAEENRRSERLQENIALAQGESSIRISAETVRQLEALIVIIAHQAKNKANSLPVVVA